MQNHEFIGIIFEFDDQFVLNYCPPLAKVPQPKPPSSCHFLSFPPLLSSNSFRTSLKNPTPFHEKSKNP
ncbi:hypothetical protein L2E82_08974 [Cichorium intybus]|uniref:Uncharacterized protein n=1 Tax=Cichorium intybus TaxID=13427 RepID=A0ACB9G8A1_CICIN|nr:hypothetical protein L2E82_08974 [Cichorium intybus]